MRRGGKTAISLPAVIAAWQRGAPEKDKINAGPVDADSVARPTLVDNVRTRGPFLDGVRTTLSPALMLAIHQLNLDKDAEKNNNLCTLHMRVDGYIRLIGNVWRVCLGSEKVSPLQWASAGTCSQCSIRLLAWGL